MVKDLKLIVNKKFFSLKEGMNVISNKLLKYGNQNTTTIFFLIFIMPNETITIRGYSKKLNVYLRSESEWNKITFMTNLNRSSNYDILVRGEEHKLNFRLEYMNKFDFMCGICLSDIQEERCLEPCRHMFCKKCISRWLRIRKVCPLCKRDIE